MYICMYILCVTIPSTSHYLTHFLLNLSHLRRHMYMSYVFQCFCVFLSQCMYVCMYTDTVHISTDGSNHLVVVIFSLQVTRPNALQLV